MNIGFCS